MSSVDPFIFNHPLAKPRTLATIPSAPYQAKNPPTFAASLSFGCSILREALDPLPAPPRSWWRRWWRRLWCCGSRRPTYIAWCCHLAVWCAGNREKWQRCSGIHGIFPPMTCHVGWLIYYVTSTGAKGKKYSHHYDQWGINTSPRTWYISMGAVIIQMKAAGEIHHTKQCLT